MQYTASISYGKDSLAMLEVIKRNNMPLDRIIHVDIMATKDIPADLPEMVEFKKKADKIIKERYGIEVEHLRGKESFEEYFYRIKIKGKRKGKIYGWPLTIFNKGGWCVTEIKTKILDKNTKNDVVYIGYAADEEKRLKRLNDKKIAPLALYGITEAEAFKICEELNLLSPIYKNAARGGCWFCPKQPNEQLRNLRKNYPDYWNLMLKWDKDSPIYFEITGTAGKEVTLNDYERRFALEEKGAVPMGKKFRWSMLDDKQINIWEDKG